MSLITLGLAGCSEGASTELGTASRPVSATCVTIQRGVAGDIADTQIASNKPDKSQGGMPIANLGTSGGGERQALLRADLGQIPARSRIESATLALWQSNTGRAVVRAHQALAAWDEGSITWNGFAGAFAPAVVAEVDNGGPGQERTIALDLTALVQAWVDGASANHGVLLEQSAGSATRIHTGKAGNASHRPRLEVCYTPVREPETANLFVHVLDTEGAPVPTAAVRVGEALHATDGAGRLLLEDLPPGRVVARVEARGFAPASAVVDLPPGAQAGTEVRLFPLGEPVPFEAEAGAVLERGAVRVEIPAGRLVDFRGEPVTGTVEATVVPLDPSTASMSDFPGPLEGAVAGTGEAVNLDSLAMAEVSLWQGGLPVHLAPGATATLELRLPAAFQDEVQIGDTIPAWWFDLDAGVWREEGQGMVLPASDGSDALAWVVEVSHFTWWNCDRPWTDKNCYEVTVVDPDGNPLSDVATVSAHGVSYSGVSSAHATDGDGQTCVDIKLGSTANLFVGPAYAPLASTPVTGSGPAADCAGNGAVCIPITIEVILPVICTPGASISCPYRGPADTLGVGLCQAATSTCNSTGTAWSGCVGEVLPAQETCATPFDDDCDGEANELDDGLDCECGPGDQPVTCYTGPDETEGIGTCHAGSRACLLEIGRYGACEGQVLQQPDLCSTPEDEDCDGTAMFQVWQGDFDSSEHSVEALRGCSGVEGSFRLGIDGDETEGLSAIDAIEYVNGQLRLDTDISRDVSLLPSLTTVGGDLLIGGDGHSAAVVLPSLVSVGDDVRLSEILLKAPRLQTIAGFLNIEDQVGPELSMDAFPSLVSVGGDVTLESSLIGFPLLQTIGGSLGIDRAGGSAARMDAFPSLVFVGEDVWLDGSMLGFPLLQTIEGSLDIDIQGSSELLLDAFPSLVSVGDDVQLSGGMTGFPRLQTIGGSLDTYGGSDPPIDAFPSLVSIGGDVWIFSGVIGFLQLQTIGGALFIDGPSPGLLPGFDALQSVQGISLAVIHGDVPSFNGISSLGWLELYLADIDSLSGFDGLQTVGSLVIYQSSARMEGAFPALTSMHEFWSYGSDLHVIESFPALERITYGLQIENRWYPGDNQGERGEIVDSFDVLDSIGGWLRIGDSSLSRIQGFAALTSVGSLEIQYNGALSVLDGFDRLAQAEGGMYVHDNPMLDACYVEDLEATVRANGYTGSFTAFDNGASGGACTAPP